MSIDFKGYIEFIENEFKRESASAIDLITLPIARRTDHYGCWPSLTVIEPSDSNGNIALSFRNNPSKISQNDYVYVNDMTVEAKDIITGAVGIVKEIDEIGKILYLNPAYQQRSRFSRQFRVGDRCVLDRTLPADHHGRELPTTVLRVLSGELGDTARLQRLRAVLGGTDEPRPTDDEPVDLESGGLASLLPAQQEAVRMAIETDFAMIQGPPGTGKTFVLGVIIHELVRRGKKVLVTAFTHQAINNVLDACLRHDSIETVTKVGSANTWGSRRADDRLKFIRSATSIFRNKTTPDVVGMTGYAAFGSMFRKLEHGLEEALGDRFDVVIFDEAGQLTVPLALLSMMHSDRIIMAGDHKQLPPVVKTTPAGVGFGRSIFQMLVEETEISPVLLDATWRLNNALLSFPSRHFYGSLLGSTNTSSNRKLQLKCEGESAAILDPETPSQLVLIRHEGRGQESIEEAALVTQLVCDAIGGGVPHGEIAVIASHRRQTVRIKTFLAARGHKQDEPAVDTVDRIQGRERDLIIISMTHSDEEDLMRGAEFLFLPNRFNVAITRARCKLIVVASPHFFRALPHPTQLRDRGDSVLRRMNVLKQWYFEHRADAIDATDMTAEILRDLTTESNAPTASGRSMEE